MNEKQKKEEIKEEKKLCCPFSKDLECEDCRLYQPFMGCGNNKCCVFMRMA